MEGKKPEIEFAYRYCKVAVWANEKEDGKINRSISPVTKSYKDKEEKWQNTKNLLTSDLPDAILCLQAAHEYLSKRKVKVQE